MDEVAYYNYVCYPRYVVDHIHGMNLCNHKLVGIVEHSTNNHSVIWECRGGGGFDVYKFVLWPPDNLEAKKCFISFEALDMMKEYKNGG